MKSSKIVKFALLIAVLFAGFALAINQQAFAQHGGEEEVVEEVILDINPLHPTFPLLDEAGDHVLDSGNPASTINSCGGCHDAEFIASHSFHSDVGLSNMTEPGETGNGRSWDTSAGLFGKWNPITYRYLSPQGDDTVDLTTAEWVQLFGVRHAGGGPAQYDQDGNLLTTIAPDAGNVEASIIDENGKTVSWNWEESGTVEMNCFLCHMTSPNNDARKKALSDGEFQWANTATLLGTGIVEYEDGEWVWNTNGFDDDGNLTPEFVRVQDPTNNNCGLCHGLVHVDAQTPMVLDGCTPEQWGTITTGQIMSPQKISESGINIAGKEDLRRSWDIHTERVVQCTDCHYSLNNPVYYQELTESRPDHLTFDPRRIDLGEYLYRPLHDFAKGESAQGALAPGLDNTMRTCADCHNAESTHEWLPYQERHMTALACESCHVPELYAPARQNYDWTVLDEAGEPRVDCRGIDTEGATFATSLITGYEPVLLPRPNDDGSAPLSPHNLITSWYWIYGDEGAERPVPERDLQAGWLDGDSYHADVLNVFDEDGNGKIDEHELMINSDAKEAIIVSRLSDLGLRNPRIAGEIQPYNVNHNVTHGEWATKECESCHSNDSRVTRPIVLSDYVPGGVLPTFVGNGSTLLSGDVTMTDEGALYFETQSSETGLYVLGHDNVRWVDVFGALIFAGTLLGVFVHGGLRVLATRRGHIHEVEALENVYMYTFYERLWHWLQTAVILMLIFTGLIIHKPDIFGIFSFSFVVQTHNVLAFILVANAALALFYNVASGEIKQYLPEPRGFFGQAITQTKYYLGGIFKGADHPYEKSPEHKLNPLQQITYLGLLNILLPLQIITGILMWGAQRWPDIINMVGGLPFLAPFHTLISWMFATFIVMHVYLTTTGPTPMAGIKSMIMGWDEVETHA